MGAALALSTGLPASAQYGGGGGGTTTTAPTTTAPEGEAEQPRVVADASDTDVAPGEPVTVTTPPVFAPGSPITVNIIRASDTAEAGELASGEATSDGRVSNTSTIPDLPPGVYFIYVTGTGPDGNPVVALVPIVIRAATAQAAAAESAAFQASAAPVPAQVAEVQSDLTPATEAAIVEAVTAGDAGLLVSPEGQLNVRTPEGVQAAGALPTTGSDGIATQVAVGAALLLAGTGLVLMRRKGFTK